MRLQQLTLFLALISGVGFGQSVKIDSLPPQGVLLDKGWKWHAGDNSDFAKPDFDDSKWDGIDPTKDIMDLPQVRAANVAWFRLQLNLDSQLAQQNLALQIWQTGASELYVDGELYSAFGQISRQGSPTKAFQPQGEPVFLKKNHGRRVCVAIRFGYQTNIKYIKWLGKNNPCLAVWLTHAQNINQNIVFRQLATSRYLDTYKMGLFGVLSILHIALYFSYKKQKGNLLIGLFMVITFIAFVLSYFYKVPSYYQTINTLVWLIAFINVLAILAILEIAYLLFNARKSWIYYIYWTLSIASLLFLYLFYERGWIVIVFLMLIIGLEVIRIGLSTRQKEHKLLLYGATISLIFYIIATYASLQPDDWKWIYDAALNISYLSMPISFSLAFALEFAFAHKSLEKQLQAVETLSTEKQQILATQNEVLEAQVTERTAELNQSLETLKATQAQLIQKEKLASLGELTAGIAHEIQNPLNFVNNFSEVSVDLLDELKEEAQAGNTTDVLAIADDLTQNLQKITHHGGRASAIVKGMLEHSRTSTGEKQPTDINALADEYLRLAYQGLRAKDKTGSPDRFNCELITDFTSDLNKVTVVPQEIGRVLLNLFNNAFYTVREKQKTAPADYQPTVSVATRQVDQAVEIRVRDNGGGIPDTIKDKIFQPFFTTKPTGEGTGLGLSLAYDIVTKGHGGTIEVESAEGEGTTFIVKLPI